MKKKLTEKEVEHRVAEFPYISEDSDADDYNTEAMRFREFLNEVRQEAWQAGMNDLANHLTSRKSNDPLFPRNRYLPKKD